MADIPGSPADMPQMPAGHGSGSAPVPYAGADLSPEPPDYAVDLGPMVDAGAQVMSGVAPGNSVSESAAAHDIAAGVADAPYYPGAISPIFTGDVTGDGARDDVSATVAGSVAAATGRWQDYERDMAPQGSAYGGLVIFPPSAEDPGAGAGNTLPTAGFYDPDREYGGTQGAPGYQGKAL
jgi:hypothetical protein